MNHALHMAVIADDMTGAADTGVQFCPAIGPIHMLNDVECAFADDVANAKGVAVFTNTRHVDPSTAAEIVRLAAEGLRDLRPRAYYKKIDSGLRGNLGPEIDALLLATRSDASLVAPALPEQGRTTVDDCHLINGVPVAESEIGRDPRCPVRESRLSVLLAAQSRLPVGRVGLDCIESGPASLRKRVRTLLDHGCRHITFDARQTDHLDAVAGLAGDGLANLLLVGSAGLAKSLSRVMGGRLPGIAPPSRPKIAKWLLVCGSASRVLAEQVAALVRSTGWTHLILEPLALRQADPSTTRALLHAQWSEASRTPGVIVSIAPIRGVGPTQDPGQVVRGLAEAAADLIDRVQPQGVFLSGGDTADAFWRAIDARALLIREEILPGLVHGEFIGGPCHGLPVVTKAGAFGQPDTLTQLIHRLE